MKGVFGNISSKLAGLLPALAMLVAVGSVNAFCVYISHQPDVPQELLK